MIETWLLNATTNYHLYLAPFFEDLVDPEMIIEANQYFQFIPWLLRMMLI